MKVLIAKLGIVFLTVIGTLFVIALFYFGNDYIKLKTEEQITNPTPFPTHTVVPTPQQTVQKPIYKNDQQAENSSQQQVIIPTAIPKIAVFVTYSNQTFYCRSEGIDAIKSADVYLAKALEEYKTCNLQMVGYYSKCMSNCNLNNPTVECKNSCQEKYSYTQCSAPKEEPLRNLVNQYCK